MAETVESTTRGPRDFFHFGVTFLGALITISGVVTVSVRATVCGLIFVVFGMAYFLVTGCGD